MKFCDPRIYDLRIHDLDYQTQLPDSALHNNLKNISASHPVRGKILGNSSDKCVNCV